MTFCISKAQAWSHFKMNSTDFKEYDEFVEVDNFYHIF